MPEERVVYLLGAGFSQPLGLPVMSDFLTKSKDQFASEPGRYEYFRRVFDSIRELATVKNFFTSDQFNIEEILSLLEMHSQLEERTELRDDFLRYLQDVIVFHTPPLEKQRPEDIPSNWHNSTFLADPTRTQHLYAVFTANLHDALIEETRPKVRSFKTTRVGDSPCHYAVVTLNYDMVIEEFTKHLALGGDALPILNDPATPDNLLDTGLPIAKLHGSVGGHIVPPTWNKSFHPEILGTWRLAHRLLSKATHVRVIGYSLPESDAYVRFLLKSAVLRSERLKSIHVICKDPEGSVERRYRDFVTFPMFRFVNADTLTYLRGLDSIIEQQSAGGDRNRVWVRYGGYLERHHAKAFE